MTTTTNILTFTAVTISRNKLFFKFYLAGIFLLNATLTIWVKPTIRMQLQINIASSSPKN
jgi:hypothetical protein